MGGTVMKKFMRLVTLVLVLAVAVTILALPAAAVTDCTDACSAEEVEPRGPVLRCSCGGTTVSHGTQMIDGVKYWVGECDTCGKFLKLLY